MNKHSIILSHSGKQHSYYVAKALLDLGYLQKFYTSSYISSKWLQGLINSLDLTFWSRRFESGLGGQYVDSNWKYEIGELVARKLNSNSKAVNELVYKRDVSFDRDISKRLLRKKYECFWGFQGSSLESIKIANQMNAHSICEMTIAHLPYAQRVLNEEAKLHPEWEDSIDFTSFPVHYEKRLIEEPYEAKSVIAISDFLKKTLVEGGIEPAKIKVIPLGFDISAIRYVPETVSLKNRPLRLLYAGRITQRKGMKYLLEAIKSFSVRDVELHIIGNIHGTGNAFNQYKEFYHFKPGVTQQVLFGMYSKYDALVFPSVLEGFGLVTVEAMGAGLPVITTPNTNATELVVNGENGFVIPIRDTEAIIHAIRTMRNLTDEKYISMRACARATALKYTWDVHRLKISEMLTELN
ncbi:glycosyltransferase family 4 protein [Flavitalea sp.]|nr:glycosyltransferase family 4 protein [Flavitalea sp.]